MTGTKVLVTGATGFIAGHCIKELLTHGYAVRGSVRNPATADVAHLHALARRTGGSLELVQARLDADSGWSEAVAGCAYVWHVASPNPSHMPKNEDEVIRPAVDGTLRVLRAAAASGTVRRVILTSSTFAITTGHGRTNPRVHTEADWANVAKSDPYDRSKVYAERAAWDFVQDQDLELATINPGLVLGPLLHTERPTSLEVVRKLLSRELPAVPRLGFAVVDARDVAIAHRLAMQIPRAAGNRYICANETMWMGDVAAVLAAEFGSRGYRIPTRPLPYWLMWTIGRFDKTVRRGLTLFDEPVLVSTDKARQELGWAPRPARESIVDTAESLLQYEVVPRHAADKHVNTPQAAPST